MGSAVRCARVPERSHARGCDENAALGHIFAAQDILESIAYKVFKTTNVGVTEGLTHAEVGFLLGEMKKIRDHLGIVVRVSKKVTESTLEELHVLASGQSLPFQPIFNEHGTRNEYR